MLLMVTGPKRRVNLLSKAVAADEVATDVSGRFGRAAA